jgi:F-type H+-transporting ATPase subunit b
MAEFESFVGVNFWTMLFSWGNILILYIFLKKILFVPIKNMIDSRQKEIDDMYDDANKSKSDAEQMRHDYEEKLENAKAESEEIVKSAVRKAKLKEEAIINEAQDKAAMVLKRADEQIEQDKKKALNDIKNEVSDLAVGIAGAVLERDIDASEHSDLIDKFIEQIGEE